MFFANDAYGKKIHIDNADVKQLYFCPACGSEMIQRRGNIISHHFAHKAKEECDPWYTEKLSSWHTKMQNHFDKSMQEVVIWNKAHTIYHIADIAMQTNEKKYVIEFQHSPISQKEFISRSNFYLECGYTLIWVFDFCECKSPKTIFVSDYKSGITHLVWPGKDRVKFLDGIDFASSCRFLYIFFHINSGMGRIRAHTSEQYGYWETWEYIHPFFRHSCFVRLLLDEFEKVDKFMAQYYSEEHFFRTLNNLGK